MTFKASCFGERSDASCFMYAS